MDPDVDETKHPGLEDLEWGNEAVKEKKPKGLYSRTSETARGLISTERQCALFCGGKKCKYCSAAGWDKEEMAIDGLYSHWVTENILAMARPSNDCIKKHDLVKHFLEAGIRSIVNLQIAGEHADCGPHDLDPSGFLYNPQSFMEKEVFFYNFGWPDYGVASLSTILDMVKVMQFAVSEGKVAVHCHAGRGRTGVIIACYLVFTNRISGQDAIHYVRDRRPHSIQTRPQMEVIEEFEKYLKPFQTVFASRRDRDKDREKGSHEFSLQQFLNRQRHILHGYEARRLKYIPKVIYTVCERLLQLAKNQTPGLKEKEKYKLNSDKAKENLKPTFASLSNTNTNTNIEKTSDKAKDLEQIGSKDSLSTLKKKKRYKKSLATRRERKGSISMEDLDDDEFKKVLAEPNSSSGSSGRSRVTINEEDDDFDDDASIVYGNSCINLQSAANSVSAMDNDKNRVNGNGINCDSVSMAESMMSEWSIDDEPISSAMSESHVQLVANALSTDEIDYTWQIEAVKHETKLNESDLAWESLSCQENPNVLSLVLWDWLDHLKEPVLRAQDLHIISQWEKEPKTGLKKIEKGTRGTIEYIVKVLLKLKPLREDTLVNIYEKLLSHLTHQWVVYDGTLASTWAGTMQVNSDKEHWKNMKTDMAGSLFHFFFNLQEAMDGSRDAKLGL